MSPDPMYKGPPDFSDPIPKSQGRGSIDTDKDYSSNFTSLRSRILYLTLCILPYIAICIFIYLEGLETLALILLAIPLELLGLFWFLQKKLKA